MSLVLPAAAYLALFGLALGLAVARQAPGGAVAGMVVDDETGAPVVGAEVRLTRAAGTQPVRAPGAAPSLLPLPAATDGRGRFIIRDVEPGLYRASVSAEGYVRQEYGQLVADGLHGSGTVLTVTADRPPADVTIRLIATGVVTGYVRDVSGRPLAGVDMQLLAPAYDSTGGRSLSPAAAGRTNDRGAYRIYWVTPGRYYLAAGASTMPPGALGRSPNVGWEGGVTFHPGVWDPAQAELITIRPRVELNVDLAVSRNRFEVRGLVVDMETGQRPPHIHVELQPARAVTGRAFLPLRPAGAAYNPADGTFGIRDVPPGRYYATGTVPGPGSLVRRSRPVPIVVSGADLDGVVIALESSVSISGRARMDDGAPLPAASAGMLAQLPPGVQFPIVSLQASSGGQRLPDVATGIRGGAPAADGTFTLEDVLPGEYRLSFPRRHEYPDHYVKEARYGDADALHGPIVVDASRPQTLEIVLSARTGGIAGIVVDAGGRPMPAQPVVLAPDRNRDRTDLYRIVHTDAEGRFTMRGIAPGDYRLFAWEALAPYAYFDEGVLATYEPAGTPVRVAESSALAAEVRIIPAR